MAFLGRTTLTAGMTALAVTLGATTLGAGIANAADEPANLIKYRQSTMKAIGGHMGAIAGVVKGEVSFSDELFGHAHAINEMSKNLLRLFPKGSGTEAGETRALPAIWEKPGDFEASIKTLQDESAKLMTAAKSGDMGAIGAQVGALGKNACGGCHKAFRKKK
jgi:cytochrome c556